MGNEELVHMYQKRLGDAGYITFQLARTNNRGDGKAPQFNFVRFLIWSPDSICNKINKAFPGME